MIGGDTTGNDCDRAGGAGKPASTPVGSPVGSLVGSPAGSGVPPGLHATIGGVPFTIDHLTLAGFEIGPGSLDEKAMRSIFRVRLEIDGDSEVTLVETDAVPAGAPDRPIRAFRFISLTPDQSRTLQRWTGMPGFPPSPPLTPLSGGPLPTAITGAMPRPSTHTTSRPALHSASYRATHQFNPVLIAISSAIALGFGALYFGGPALQASLFVPSVSATVVPGSYTLSIASSVPPPHPVRIGQTETSGELIGYLPRGEGMDNRVAIYSPCHCSVAAIYRIDPGRDGGDLAVNLVKTGGLGLRLVAQLVEDDWKMLEPGQSVEVSFSGVPYPVLGRLTNLSAATMPPDDAGHALSPSGDTHTLRTVTVTIERWPGVDVFPSPGKEATLRFPVPASRMLAHYTGLNLPFLDDWLRPAIRVLDGGSATPSSAMPPAAPQTLADN